VRRERVCGQAGRIVAARFGSSAEGDMRIGKKVLSAVVSG
jgi:hypothetical protein